MAEIDKRHVGTAPALRRADTAPASPDRRARRTSVITSEGKEFFLDSNLAHTVSDIVCVDDSRISDTPDIDYGRSSRTPTVLVSANGRTVVLTGDSVKRRFKSKKSEYIFPWHVINPNSMARFVWDALLAFVLIYYSFMIPFAIAYHVSDWVFLASRRSVFLTLFC